MSTCNGFFAMLRAYVSVGIIRTMIKVFRYRIKDSVSGDHLNKMSRSVSYVWNFCNDTQKAALKWNKRWPSGFDLSNLTAGSGKELGLHSQTVQAICEEYAIRRKQFNRPYLRYRGKKSLGWIPFKKSGIKVNGDSLIYCGQRFKVWLSRPLDGQIKSGNFSQDARGRWYINLACEVADLPATEGKAAIGVDLGLKDLATCSDGTKIEAKRFYRDLEPKLAIAQRANKKKQVKAIHAKIANRRNDFLHKESTRLVRENAAIFVGNVSSSKLAKTKMAKSVLDAGWSMLKNQLSYKAMARQVIFQVVDESYTTRCCSECGALSGPKGIADIGIREWVCNECGVAHDRDVNSARLILRSGHRALAGGIPLL